MNVYSNILYVQQHEKTKTLSETPNIFHLFMFVSHFDSLYVFLFTLFFSIYAKHQHFKK